LVCNCNTDTTSVYQLLYVIPKANSTLKPPVLIKDWISFFKALPFAMYITTLKPFFFDARNTMDLITSFENLLILLSLLWFVYNGVKNGFKNPHYIYFLSIVILANSSKSKLGMMFLWLFAWTVCGLVVLFNYFSNTNQDVKLVIIVYLSFWLYFEYKIIKAFIWKKFGAEKIWLQDGQLNYQREINKKGKIYSFDSHLIDEIKVIEIKNTSWADNINQSFWIRGGERLEFAAMGKTIRFGMQLEDEEARALINMTNKFMKK